MSLAVVVAWRILLGGLLQAGRIQAKSSITRLLVPLPEGLNAVLGNAPCCVAFLIGDIPPLPKRSLSECSARVSRELIHVIFVRSCPEHFSLFASGDFRFRFAASLFESAWPLVCGTESVLFFRSGRPHSHTPSIVSPRPLAKPWGL